MRIHKVRGFSLVEVMVALVIMALGLLALSKFHSVLFKSTADAQNRTTALMIAEAKLEDLRNFAQISISQDPNTGTPIPWDPTDPNLLMAFDYISSDATDLCDPEYTNAEGGRIEEGEATLNGTTYTGFNLAWRVTSFWHDSDTGIDNCNPAGVGSPDYKVVDVLVSWQDESGDSSSVTLSQIISSVNPGGTFLLANVSAGNPGPKVIHDPGVAPEVIPVCISGNCDGSDPEALQKETDNPEPEVSQNNEFAAVSFSELSYFNNTNVVAKREDFLTVNCVCELQAGDADVTTYEPAYIVLGENESGDPVIENIAGEAVNDANRRYGERINTGQDGQQNELCDVCCRDHHDFTDAERKYDPFRPEGVENYPLGLNGDHGHFYLNNQGDLEAANDIGDIYYEACKMVRIDGLWRVGQDWKQESLKIIPDSVLISNATNYQNYVADFIEDYIAQIDPDSYPLITPNPETVLVDEKGSVDEPYAMSSPNAEQMIARSIFIDYMPPELISKLKTDGVDLEIVPFRDINSTKLAIWDSSNTGVVSVTNEPIENNNAHSRGNVFALSAGTATVTVSMPLSNTGLTNSNSTDPNDGNLFTEDEIVLSVSGPPAAEDVVVLGGTISVAGDTFLDFDQVVVAGVGGVQCSQFTVNPGKVWTYECDFIAGQEGSIRFSNYNVNECIGNKNSCVQTFFNNAITPSSGEYVVTNDNSINENTLLTTTLTTNETRNILVENESTTP